MESSNAKTNRSNTTVNRKYSSGTHHIKKPVSDVYDPAFAYSGYLEVERGQENIKVDRPSNGESWGKLIKNIGVLIIIFIKLGWAYIRYRPHHNRKSLSSNMIDDPIDEICK